jgi:hypothetical protein
MIVALAPHKELHAARREVHAVVRYARNKPRTALEQFFHSQGATMLPGVPPLSTVNLVMWVPSTLSVGRALDALTYAYSLSLLRSVLLVPCSFGLENRMCALAQKARRALGFSVDACLEPGFGHGNVVRCSSFVSGAVPIVAPSSEHFPKFRRVHARLPFTSLYDLPTLLAHACGDRSVRPLRAEAVQVELGIAHAQRPLKPVSEN